MTGVGFGIAPAFGAARRESAEAIDRRRVAIAGALLAAVPLFLVAAVRNPSTMHVARDENAVQEAPLTKEMDVTSKRNADGSVTIRWRTPSAGGAQPSFVVYYAPTRNSFTSNDNGCTRPDHGALECFLNTALRLGTTQENEFVDRSSTPNRWYRVALVAGYQRASLGGDLMLVSNAVRPPQTS